MADQYLAAVDNLSLLCWPPDKVPEGYIRPGPADPDGFAAAVLCAERTVGLWQRDRTRAGEVISGTIDVLATSMITVFSNDVRYPRPLPGGIRARHRKEAARARTALPAARRRAERAWRKRRLGTATEEDVRAFGKCAALRLAAERDTEFEKARAQRLYGARQPSLSNPVRSSVLTDCVLTPLYLVILRALEPWLSEAEALGQSRADQMPPIPSERRIGALVLEIARTYLPPEATDGLTADAVIRRIRKSPGKPPMQRRWPLEPVDYSRVSNDPFDTEPASVNPKD